MAEQQSAGADNTAFDAPAAVAPCASTGRVALVGAGPGHPGLLTLWAVECLAEADFVLYDRLAPAAFLQHAPTAARKLCVDELAGCHPERWPLIHQTMIDAARQGLRVVRLKGGDPLVFGRGGEEAEALRAAGIPFEIVPGVTAALGAAACAGIPLTHRQHASAVAFVTGHEKPGGRVDWPALAAFPGTLVVYMGVGRLPDIVDSLFQHGKAPATPAAAVSWTSTGRQRTVEAELAALPEAVRAAGLTAPALVIIGDVVRLRPNIGWFESRPLFGKRVLVTRPAEQGNDFARRLELLGAIPLLMPAIEVREPTDRAPINRALAQLGTYQWLVFTSVHGVHFLVRHLRAAGRDLRALGHLQLAAIGPATADALRSYHLEPDLVPAEFRSESLAEALKERAAGKRILLARADRGRELLRDELARVAEVEQIAVYSQVDAPPDESLMDELRRGEVDFVTLTSSNIARSLLPRLADEGREQVRRGRVQLVSISPVTSATVRELGLPVAAEAREYTIGGLLQALRELAGGSGASPSVV